MTELPSKVNSNRGGWKERTKCRLSSRSYCEGDASPLSPLEEERAHALWLRLRDGNAADALYALMKNGVIRPRMTVRQTVNVVFPGMLFEEDKSESQVVGYVLVSGWRGRETWMYFHFQVTDDDVPNAKLVRVEVESYKSGDLPEINSPH